MQALELTRQLLRFNTVNPPGNERDCARHLGRLLDDAGFAVAYHEFADKRTSLIARVGGTADTKPLCFTGHIDTVPLGAVSWRTDAFAGDIDDGRLYGRGSSDGDYPFDATPNEFSARRGAGSFHHATRSSKGPRPKPRIIGKVS